jgi:hypothetical protein
MVDETNLSQLRMMAASAGLKLSEDELQRLLPGVNRSRAQAEELRGLLAVTVEPAGTFAAAKPG